MDTLITEGTSYLRDSAAASTGLGAANSTSATTKSNNRSFTSYSSDVRQDSSNLHTTTIASLHPITSLSSSSTTAPRSTNIYDKYGLDTRYSSSSAWYNSSATTTSSSALAPTTTFTSTSLNSTTGDHYRSSALDSYSHHHQHLANLMNEASLSPYKSKSSLYQPTTSSLPTTTTSSSYLHSNNPSSSAAIATTTTTSNILAGLSSNASAIIDKYSNPSYTRDLHLHTSSLYGQRDNPSSAANDNSILTNGVGSRSLSHLPASGSGAATSKLIASSTTAIDTNNSNSIATRFGANSNPLASNTIGAISRAQSGLGGGATSASIAGASASAGGHNILQQLFDDMRQIEDTVDSIEIPARGRCKVFMAKYGYDPYKQSPNDNPDNELAFNAGDYIMVFDDMDEDGYFIGELMDGRRGYVPSNWLDRLTGEDLFDFQATTLYKQQGGASGAKQHVASSQQQAGGGLLLDEDGCPSESASYPPEFYDAILTDAMQHSHFQHLLAPEDYRRMNDYVDLDDVDEVDDECLSDYERAEAEQMRRAVPPPQKLLLERQLNKSILISWLHPEAAKGTIISYQVYVDGVLKSTVPSGDRTKALLEGVDSTIPHRISVRAIDLSGRHSNDAGCTIVIGQRIPFAPSCVKASHITSDSALISWLPCNSNFHHVVAVNSVEVQTVRPGVYKHLINGLSANTVYRVWVRAKPGKILSVDEKNPKKLESLTTFVDFKTMPKSLPDPPVNVQVEAGPQRRTLLVTWLPLTLNNSNGCPVTGYAVFAGHKKLADIDSPTGDHALLDLTDLESLHKKSVTVRTKSGENLSQDSMSCQIPDEYLKNAAPRSQSDSLSHHHNQLSGRMKGGQSGDLHNRSLTESSNHHHGGHSPSRHPPGSRYSAPMDSHGGARLMSSSHHMASPRNHPNQYRSSSMNRGRQMARSLQNLESDLDSRRSSIPAIEIARDTANRAAAGGDYSMNNFTESYSEEEFENSMRFRGVRDKSGNRANSRYRAKRYYSIDGSPAHIQARASVQGNLSRTSRLAGGDVRYFVALFDYDPSTMSPNPNAAIEELAFKEGSIIKIIGDKGPDGFYRGELDNHIGFVPCNVVSEITDPNVLYSLNEKMKRQQQLPGVPGNLQNYMVPSNTQQQIQAQQQQQQRSQLQQAQNLNDFELQQQQQSQQQQTQQPHQSVSGVKRMVALYDYNPQENSPNVDTESEIPFKVGDIIYVYGKMDTDGFYIGEVERTKQKGLVPSNFLREEPLATNIKPPMMQDQQQLLNQMNPQTGGATNMGQVMDPMQQQRIQNQVQMGMNPMQQQLAGTMVDSAGFTNQQQVGNMMTNPQMRGNIRGMVPSQVQQNINRPTTLSLGSNFNPNQMSNNPNDWNQQQQQQQQQRAGGLNQMNDMQLNLQQQSMNNNPQQQQQTGMLSNLLSSGKQMINAAATPRGPNQAGQFPMNQAGNPMMGGPNAGLMGNAGAMNMGMAMGNNDLSNNMMDATGNFAGRPNMMQGGGMGNPMQQQQQQQPHQQQPMQQFNQMAFSRGPMNQQPGGEDQGGNILSTVKNMFKL